MRPLRHFATMCAALLLMKTPVFGSDEPLPRGKPEEVGFSSQRLARIGAVLQEDIDNGRIPGAVVAVARHGKLVLFEAYGWRNKDARVPMTTDTIFNVASMTKPMTAVGALMLYEQGRLLMDDPLAKYFPPFADARVAARDANGDPTAETVPAQRKITIQDLFRHTSGIIYGGRGSTVVHKMYPEGSAAASTMTGEAFAEKLASLPLLHQPGAVWDYGFGLDLLGLTVEQIAKQSLGAYLQDNLWRPLGMDDTGFYIPPEKAARYAKPLAADPLSGKPQSIAPDLTQKPGFDCGGGCAASTASDYMRFALLLLHGGNANGKQILGRKTVEYMLSDQLGPTVKNLVGNADPTRADFSLSLIHI